MAQMPETVLGSVAALWRYPVKSMMGEELNAAEVTERGLAGDRAYALVDVETGKVASAKAPRKWGKLFEFRAAYMAEPRAGEKLPPARITLPDGALVTSEQGDISRTLSDTLGREITLTTEPPKGKGLKLEWCPPGEETMRDYRLPADAFFDLGVIHLLTTASVDRLRELYPQGRFEVRRFRPNIVVRPASGEKGFVEETWIGHTLALGDQVRLRILAPCIRCVMTTLPQGDLPADPGILRAAAQHNQANVGVYATVVRGGVVRRGDEVRV